MAKSIEDLNKKILDLIRNDSEINHFRINVINGGEKYYLKYMSFLSELVKENPDLISIKYYPKYKELINDVLIDDELHKDWFNLFIFNINHMDYDVQGVIAQMEDIFLCKSHLEISFKDKMYTYFSVTDISRDETQMLNKHYEKFKDKCVPIKHLNQDFTKTNFLLTITDILSVHSCMFMEKFERAYNKLESLVKESSILKAM